MKQYIVIDFDDVIVNTMPLFCNQVNYYLRRMQTPMGTLVKTNWVPEDFLIWDAAKTTGLSNEKIVEFFDAIDYSEASRVPGSVQSILLLIEQGHSIQIVTANPRELDIRNWLDIHFLGDVPLTTTRDKIDFMIRRGFNVIIEDNPKTLTRAIEAGKTAIRFERPWNERMKQYHKNHNF